MSLDLDHRSFQAEARGQVNWIVALVRHLIRQGTYNKENDIVIVGLQPSSRRHETLLTRLPCPTRPQLCAYLAQLRAVRTALSRISVTAVLDKRDQDSLDKLAFEEGDEVDPLPQVLNEKAHLRVTIR